MSAFRVAFEKSVTRGRRRRSFFLLRRVSFEWFARESEVPRGGLINSQLFGGTVHRLDAAGLHRSYRIERDARARCDPQRRPASFCDVDARERGRNVSGCIAGYVNRKLIIAVPTVGLRPNRPLRSRASNFTPAIRPLTLPGGIQVIEFSQARVIGV